ncbi:Sulfate adenylyltransferase, large subunit/ ATP-sulfurylase, subunit 1 (ATP:sulfate adenylyltransferase) [Propionibacterium freudenreichii]|uniref:sulfate adenylyltransferase subunit 1 n=1 Tax=Propionibacterium freudenreichii TaxID=1744 RepID=UPI0005A5C56A|nr:GTP-binding protein [Propionibacterium freudenreichii]MCT2984053.1 sulfate adenylyltransferase [Propionibacterium freudenreichii]MCT2996788.1 sulfate adenylyltransferase [Propionibacterium freudenreichii]MDK9295013.1 50S ribosome-binding GTPase [Propionibacterium freudenreichii]MDK9346762.1 50S ribosome-binding GTPase [Propionibacterium freudenreichii]MDK9360381.1 50S ribosome-binding GTPase [Propionibacterium freudenreichii]
MSTLTDTTVNPEAALTQRTLLHLATAGSVDDGKSTLVGRLMYDSKAVLADQLEAVERVSHDKGLGTVDLALLTDGLRAEREQGITIDVAYRYFSSAERSYILADCPGHVQYTRNTVTGSSTADVLVLLVDVRKGVLQQTRRHLAVGALLRVPHVIVAVNKIDLVDFDEAAYAPVEKQIREVAHEVGLDDITVIPTSALTGANIVDRSDDLPWYTGPSLLELLDNLDPVPDAVEGFRLPVQLVLRPQGGAIDPQYVEYRGYAGEISAGRVHVGDPVVVLPSGLRSTVAGIDLAGEQLDEAVAGQSVSLRLADEIDAPRGSLISSVADAPEPVKQLEATVAWMAEKPLHPGARVLLKHGTSTVKAIVSQIVGKLDLDEMAPVTTDTLELNDIGRVSIRLAAPVMAESYLETRHGGAFVLIDPQSGWTLAAGMVRGHEVFGDSLEPEPDWQI